MRVEKGMIHPAIWSVLQTSITCDAVYPQEGLGGSVANFLRLPQQVQAEVKRALIETRRFSSVEVYSLSVPKGPFAVAEQNRYRFVIGLDTKNNRKDLLYPSEIDDERMQIFQARASVVAKSSLYYFAARAKDDWAGCTLVLILSVLFLGVGLNDVLPALKNHDFKDFFGVFLTILGVFGVMIPLVVGFMTRLRLRRALNRLTHDPNLVCSDAA